MGKAPVVSQMSTAIGHNTRDERTARIARRHGLAS
jgi:hypothetical protein